MLSFNKFSPKSYVSAFSNKSWTSIFNNNKYIPKKNSHKNYFENSNFKNSHLSSTAINIIKDTQSPDHKSYFGNITSTLFF